MTYMPEEYVTVGVYVTTTHDESKYFWYETGTLIPGTARSFMVEDFPQVKVYVETMARRYVPDELHFGAGRSRVGHSTSRNSVRSFADREAPTSFSNRTNKES